MSDAPAAEVGAVAIPSRVTGAWVALLGAVGLTAAFTLAVDKYRILEDPSFSPACDINPVLSCGSVMVTDQASAFGFPNPLIGVIGFSVVVTIGVVLAAGTRVATWVLGGLAAGSLAGVAMVHWLVFQSLYRIGALCPWCLVVWAATIVLAVWSVLLPLRVALPSRATAALWSVRYLVVLAWWLVIVVLVLERFWYYWRTLL